MTCETREFGRLISKFSVSQADKSLMRLRSIFIFITLLGSSVTAKAIDCSIRPFLNQTLTEASATQPHSKWGMSPEVLAFNSKFEKISFSHSKRKMMNTFENSLAAQQPELIKILEDMNRMQMNTYEFSRQFEKAYWSKPQVDEIHAFYQSRFDAYRSGLNEFIREVKKMDTALGLKIEISMMDQTHVKKQIIDQLVNAKDAGTVMSHADRLNQRMAGSFAELHAAASLPSVKHMGATLSHLPEVKEAFSKKLKNVLARVNGDPEALARMTERYPKVFRNNFIRFHPPKNLRERFDMIQDWIGRKEIDLIREPGGKTRWVEVKMNREPFNLATFRAKGHNDKSMYDQILEDKQIIEFLGLSDKIQLEYLATGGLESEVMSELENLGVKVLSAH